MLGVVGAIFYWLWSNTVHNLEVRRIATGFGFLDREAGLPIGESLIEYSPTDTYLRALLVGLLESYSSFWASAYKEVIVFTLIIPVLLWRSLRAHHVEEDE